MKYVSLYSLFVVVCPKFEFLEGSFKVEKFLCVFPGFELPLDSHFNLRLFGFKASVFTQFKGIQLSSEGVSA